MGNWYEINWGKGNGDVALPTENDGKNAVACIDAVLIGRTNATSFMRSDGQLIEVFRSSQTGRIVIQRAGGNWRSFDVDEAKELRDRLTSYLNRY